ncbi:MAG: UDP-N-acetylmuramate dehydrogenase [Acidobacteria bacterium]|nr:UDP-N-acetylmuramate dehydrogenase [Acidobacteriota bacterium]
MSEAEAILRESRVPVLRDVPLRTRTSLGVGGPARLFLVPGGAEDLADVLERFAAAGVAFDYLGAGSNLLVADAGPSFVVISSEGLDQAPEISRETVRVGAGYSVPKLANRVAAAGLSGLEFAEGIPGSVGGCVRMNAGWHEGMFGDAVSSFLAVSRHGEIEEIISGPGTFEYRRSPGVGDRFVAAATLRLTPDDPARVKERMKAFHDRRVSTQPTGAKNAGCIFRNPPDDHAGRLIDACGLKGLAVGRAVVSDAHANFIINQGGATYRDVAALIDRIRDTVSGKTGITLETEVVRWT